MSIDSGSMSCCSVPTFTVFGLGRRIGDAKTDLNDSGISPVQMLGTVYYDTDQLLKNAEQAGKYTIVDDLEESADAGAFRGWYFRLSGSGASAFRKLSRTMTTWDGRTLYAILDKSDKDRDEVGGRVQKINLVDAKAVWWSEGLDMEYPWTYIAGPFRGSITGGGVPGGAPVDFWGGFVPQYPENVNAIVSESCWGLEDFKDAAYYGFGDLGFGKLGISENETKGGNRVVRLDKVDEDGTGTATTSVDKIKGNGNTDKRFHFTSASGDSGSFSEPERVLPVSIAPNDWPYGVGIYVETMEVADARTVEEWTIDFVARGREYMTARKKNGSAHWWWAEAAPEGVLGITDPVGEVTYAAEMEVYGPSTDWFTDELLDVWGYTRGTLHPYLIGWPPTGGSYRSGYYRVTKEDGFTQHQYRLVYCSGAIISGEAGELPYIATSTATKYESDWVYYYAPIGGYSSGTPGLLSAYNRTADFWADSGFPETISVHEAEDLDRYRARGFPYQTSGVNADFKGGLVAFNCTADHTPVILFEYAVYDPEKDSQGNPLLPSYDPLDQEGQVDGEKWPPILTIPDNRQSVYQRLVFGGHKIWDSKTDATILDQVEVLTGNKIAILTHTETEGDERDWNVKGRSPQSLTVYDSGGEVVFTLKADGVFPDNVRGEQEFSNETRGGHGATVVTCSDRWIHVRMFPLDVEEHTDLPSGVQQELVSIGGVGLEAGHYISWLISLDGEVKVPARFETINEIKALKQGLVGVPPHHADAVSARSWASDNIIIFSGIPRYDAARSSAVIEGVSPGTMHPDEFF